MKIKDSLQMHIPVVKQFWQVVIAWISFSFSFGVDYVQRWGRPSTAAQCATPT